MHVGIITFHCSYNFGSSLQAFALSEAIREICGESEVIDYRSRDFIQYQIFHPLRPWTIPRSLLNYRRLAARKRAFRSFWRRRFVLTERTYTYRRETKLEELQDQYDCFVCGSDQIWNLDCTGGVVGPYFLSFAGGRRRVAYGPSLAQTSFAPENFDRGRVAELLARFDFLSVREEETVPLFQPLVDKRIEVVLDPTLLLGASAYADMVGERVLDGPYIFVYLLRDCPELVESASAMAEATGIRVAYVSERGLPIPNSRNLFGIGPEEFVSLIAHADAVLANSFHSTVFSVLFHRPFRAFATDRSASRMRDLLEKLGIPERCAYGADASEIEDVDWETVDARLDALRAGSWNYLRRALS